VRPYLRRTLHKNRVGVVAQGVGPEFKLQHHKQTNKKSKEISKTKVLIPREALSAPHDHQCNLLFPCP
jgi:hypothetical protein